ncbi:hypothetical protein [Sediminispirochaeta bajacaliforniensis]|uniref:hypothetical protein n=1 Tax=Sediminispirochaeta bajacaliforniensis TaxID=148 RepID=UPI00037C81D3|nr:hypothetical protein [Sediminispirochaeta bajacaliforniensis]
MKLSRLLWWKRKRTTAKKSGQSARKPRPADVNYVSVSAILRKGDREAMEAFFKRNHHLKKGDFYRDAIIDAMLRYDRAAGEREAILAGRTQIDPSMVKGA